MTTPPPDHPAQHIRRRGSAHEEHLFADGRRWCAICGWIDEMSRWDDNYALYHRVERFFVLTRRS